MGALKTVLLIFITIFIPPIGVFLVAGCGIDLLINILLTCLGYVPTHSPLTHNVLTLRSYIPGHIHAFYLEYVFYKKRDEARAGIVTQRAAGVYSERVQRGGRSRHPVSVPAQQGFVAPQQQQQQQQGYGAI
jgi:uncharacterized membrane protein YqaE (UPF0057 family)